MTESVRRTKKALVVLKIRRPCLGGCRHCAAWRLSALVQSCQANSPPIAQWHITLENWNVLQVPFQRKSCCFPVSVILFQLISFQGFNLMHGAAKTLHACLQLASLLLGVLALAVVVIFHNVNRFPNFYRWVAWGLQGPRQDCS